MKRLVLLLVAFAGSTLALSTPASAAAAKCILIPDGDGHVKEFCLR